MLAQARADLTAPEKDKRLAACEFLTTAPVVNAERPAVAQALNGPLADTDYGVVEMAMKALARWYTADNVPALAVAVGKSDFRERPAAMELLGKLKDARGAEAVVARLANPAERPLAANALIAMGPVAAPSCRSAKPPPRTHRFATRPTAS